MATTATVRARRRDWRPPVHFHSSRAPSPAGFCPAPTRLCPYCLPADASDRLTPEEKAALAAQVEALKPALAAWREKHAPKVQAHYTRALAAAKEDALARGEADPL